MCDREQTRQAVHDAIQAYLDLNRAEEGEPSAMLTGWTVLAASSPNLARFIPRFVPRLRRHASIGLAQLAVQYSEDFL